jgi:large subunit ribosomal protein L35
VNGTTPHFFLIKTLDLRGGFTYKHSSFARSTDPAGGYFQEKCGVIMPKMKTKQCAAKRFSKTGTGKLKRNHMGGSHILSNKNRKRKRTLRSSDIVDKADMKRITPYI